jgi:hypothetical protein
MRARLLPFLAVADWRYLRAYQISARVKKMYLLSSAEREWKAPRVNHQFRRLGKKGGGKEGDKKFSSRG